LVLLRLSFFFFFSSRRRHTRCSRDWSSDVCSSDLTAFVIGRSFPAWMAGATLLGIGTALVYPTLLAAVSDVAHPDWRASAVGVYRLWRDSGYAIGAIAAGLLADAFTMPFAVGAIAALTFASGVVVASVMYETLPDGSTGWRVGPINA